MKKQIVRIFLLFFVAAFGIEISGCSRGELINPNRFLSSQTPALPTTLLQSGVPAGLSGGSQTMKSASAVAQVRVGFTKVSGAGNTSPIQSSTSVINVHGAAAR